MGGRRNTILQKPRLPPIPNTRSRHCSYRLGLRSRILGQYFADFHTIRPVLFPLVQRQAVGLEQFPNVPRPPVEQLIENRHHDAERVLAQHRAPGDPRELLVFRNGNREPVMVVDMQHHVNVGTTVADIDHTIGCDAQSMLELLDYRNLAVAGGHALARTNFLRIGVEFQLGAVDVFGRYYSGKRRDDDFARSCRYYKKREPIPFRAALHEVDERRNRALEADTTASLDKMFTPYAAKFRIVTDQIGQLAALLHEIAPGKACNTILKSRYPPQLAQPDSRTV